MTTPRALLLSLFTFTAACEPTLFGSSEVTTLNPAADGFERLQLSTEVDAVVTQGSPRRVEITINENLQDHLHVRTSGDRLEIGMDDHFDYDHLVLEVRVTMPSLAALELSGASRARLDGFERAPATRLDVGASGASRVSGVAVAGRLTVNASGASQTDLSGIARELNLELSGASHATLDGLTATLAAVELSGASHAVVWVDSEVHGEASGASSLVVRGAASMNVETSGASSVSRR
jgi:Putative auto-transporter adhesin, head GIN domain